jgi:predicted porin
MKKHLIAAAVAGALAVPAMAQVTVYGIVDVGVSSTKDGSESRTRVDSGHGASSRLGFRGEEDLGGGMKAIFQLEAGMSVDTGVVGSTTTTTNAPNEQFFSRAAMAGLSGGFGTVTAGFQNGVIHDLAAGFDPTGQNAMGTAGGFTYQARFTNNVKYVTPSISGFQVRAAFGQGAENRSTTATPDPKDTDNMQGLGVSYTAGPIGVMYAVQELKTNTTTESKRNESYYAARYNAGIATLFIGGSKRDLKEPAGAAVLRDTELMYVGATAQVGPGTLHVNYTVVETEAAAGAVKPEGKQIGLGYTYPMSKRTALYGVYGKMSNNTAGSFQLESNAGDVAAAAAGRDPSGFGFGVRHSF